MICAKGACAASKYGIITYVINCLLFDFFKVAPNLSRR